MLPNSVEASDMSLFFSISHSKGAMLMYVKGGTMSTTLKNDLSVQTGMLKTHSIQFMSNGLL